MPYSRSLSWLTMGALVWALTGVAQGQDEGFAGPSFVCSGLSSPGRASELAELWMHGHLTGIYEAAGVLKLSADGSDAEVFREMLRSKCREHPEASILSVSLGALAQERLPIPVRVGPGLSIDRYTCGEHLDGKEGEAAVVELAEWWAFAFIQGYKNVGQPEMVIELANKSVLADAIDRNCAANRDLTYRELTASVAEAVKLQP